MATRNAVIAALKIFSRAFAGVVDEQRIEVYHAALEDLTDEQLAAATVFVVKTHTGEFIPPPAVIRKTLLPSKLAAVDTGPLMRRIEKMAIYNPNVGMVYPQVGAVLEALGDEAAYAYGAAGGARVFSDNATTRDIAQREFGAALTEAMQRAASGLPSIAAPQSYQRITSGDDDE